MKSVKYKFPADVPHHVIELYRGHDDSSSDLVRGMEEQARQTGNTVRAISNGFELIAYSSYPSVTARRVGT